MSSEGIDFVITWVDGNDPAWRETMCQYAPNELGTKAADHRFRDWNLLRYWFRSVECYAPWVNKIHFVTWGHLPNWLNTSNPKLDIVKHTDYIPCQYLPTFSSHVIELNMHRINGLSEHFVYFNDDMFLCKEVREEDFFADGLPVDVAALNVHCYALSMPIQLICVRNTGVINEHFDFHDCIKSNIAGWINPKYGKKLARTIALLGAPRFPGFYMHHCAQPLLKSTLEEVWDKEGAVLDETCQHRFREETDVNQWVFKEWQLASGQFVPKNVNFYSSVALGVGEPTKQARRAASAIKSRSCGELCINDGELTREQFDECQGIIESAFIAAFPNPSSFELES